MAHTRQNGSQPDSADPRGSAADGSDGTERDVFSPIYGHNGAKAVLREALRKGDVNVMMVGPPGSGKSAFLNALEENVPGVLYRDSKNITPAKLRERLKTDPPILLLDEFDKMGDYQVLTMPMEQGRVQRDSARESYDIEIGTQFLASCNSTDPIPNHLLSRFKPNILEFEPYSEEEFLEVCEHMLPRQVGWVQTTEEARKIGRITLEVSGETDPRAARDTARMASSMKQVKTMARAIDNPEADVGSVSLKPSEIQRTKTELGRERLRELIREEMRAERGESDGDGVKASGPARSAEDAIKAEIDAAIEEEMAEAGE